MTFKEYQEAYVWIWLPAATTPIVAGKLTADAGKLTFNYGKSYLENKEAIPIYDAELPLHHGALPLLAGLDMPGSIRDAAPDAWGRRVIISKILGKESGTEVNELTYLLESGSDRIGALDFQLSPTYYEPRFAQNASLEELLESAERIEKGMPLSQILDQALFHGSSIGGARPKALIESDSKKYIAKFSSSSDIYSVVKAEFIAMRLAKIAGLNVAPVSLTTASKKDVLLIERFDRAKQPDGWERKIMLSALTLLGLGEMMARYASYEDFAEILRSRTKDTETTLRELFSRMTFNILCGNTDDHARNHAVFWDGKMLTLTPAYDICPQGRSGREASQAMLIRGNNRMSQIASCLDASASFLLSHKDASAIVTKQINVITEYWDTVCDEAELGETDRQLFWNRQFLNPYALEGLE